MDWTGMLVLSTMIIALLWGLWISMKNNFPEKHHDNRPGSYYYESNKKKWEG